MGKQYNYPIKFGWLNYSYISRFKRSNEEEEEEGDEEEEGEEEDDDESTGEKKENPKKKSKDDCDNTVKIDAFGGNYTLCLFLRHFSEEPIVRNSYGNMNVSIFNNLNVSDDVPIKAFDLYSAVGHVIEGIIVKSLLNNNFSGIKRLAYLTFDLNQCFIVLFG